MSERAGRPQAGLGGVRRRAAVVNGATVALRRTSWHTLSGIPAGVLGTVKIRPLQEPLSGRRSMPVAAAVAECRAKLGPGAANFF